MKELERGSFQYIRRRKLRLTLMVIGMVLLGVIIFISGLFINKFDKANICTVLAVLMVLPAAKFLVLLIVVFPFHSVSRERYESVKTKVNDTLILMTDMVITSPEKVMNLDFVLLTDNQVIALIGKKNQDSSYVEKYLKQSLKENGFIDYTVKVCEEEKQFLTIIPQKICDTMTKQEECLRYMRTLVV